MKLNCRDELNGSIGGGWGREKVGFGEAAIRTSECRGVKREGLVGGTEKEKAYCCASWAVRWAKAFRDYNRLPTGQSEEHVVRKREAFHHPQLNHHSDPLFAFASLPVLGSACSETTCWGESAAADWRDADRCWQKGEEQNWGAWLRGG